MLGKEKYKKLLKQAKEKIKEGKEEELITEILHQEIFSYQGFYDIANPDGDYNCFPFYEKIQDIKLSKKPLFRYFKEIKKPSLVVYGELDEYAWGDIPRVVNILKNHQPNFDYEIIKAADHSFKGKKRELADVVIPWLLV